MTYRFTAPMITTLQPDEIFVFGSNHRGAHAAGAALTALDFGATEGQGGGLSGQTFAIPTKDENIQTLPLDQIAPHIDYLYAVAQIMNGNHFLITPIGTGLAGYTAEDIAPLFGKRFLELTNCSMPQSFVEVLTKED